MSAPLCTVTPLEALRRLYDVARKVDAKEAGELEQQLQEAIHVAYWTLAVPMVPVAAQPVVPEGWQLVPIEPTEKMVCLGIEAYQGKVEVSYAAMLAAAPQPAASVTDVAKDAARYRWLSQNSAYVAVNPHHKKCLWVLRNIFEVAGDGFTEAVDAAIAAQQGEKTK